MILVKSHPVRRHLEVRNIMWYICNFYVCCQVFLFLWILTRNIFSCRLTPVSFLQSLPWKCEVFSWHFSSIPKYWSIWKLAKRASKLCSHFQQFSKLFLAPVCFIAILRHCSISRGNRNTANVARTGLFCHREKTNPALHSTFWLAKLAVMNRDADLVFRHRTWPALVSRHQ